MAKVCIIGLYGDKTDDGIKEEEGYLKKYREKQWPRNIGMVEYRMKEGEREKGTTTARRKV